MANEYYLSNRAPALNLLKGLRAQGKLSKVRNLQRDMLQIRQGRAVLSFALEYRSVSLDQGQATLVADSLRFVMGEEGHPESDDARALFDIFHMTPGVVVELTLAEWQLIGRAVLTLEGMLQETLSYETFPERHRAFEVVHALIDGDE